MQPFTWSEYNKFMLENCGDLYTTHRRDARKQMYKTYLQSFGKEMTATEVRQREDCFYNNITDCFGTLPCPTYDGGPTLGNILGCKPQPEKGNNPMNTAIVTGLTITAPKSDDMEMRSFLQKELSMFDSWRDTTHHRLRKLFNIDAPKAPQNAEELIAAIKDGKYELDAKRLDKLHKRAEEAVEDGDYDSVEDYINAYSGPFDGLKFTDLPQADRKGYDAAVKEWSKVKEEARLKLAIIPPTDGLDLLLSLKTWTPTGAAN